MVIVSEKYTDSMRTIQSFLQKVGFEPEIAVFEDDGFLPGDIITPYEYFIVRRTLEAMEEKPLFYNFIEVPAFWEIRADGDKGGIYDMGLRKAVIHFTQPIEKRNVKLLEWCTEDGWTYRMDHYNKYGLKYVSEFLSLNGEVESRVFYSVKNQETIVIQPQNDTIALMDRGKLQAYFTSYDQFAAYYIEKAVPSGTRILLIQNERQLENLLKRSDRENGWRCIMFQENKLLHEYIAGGGKKGCRFYDDPGKYPVNHANGRALILTASDQIEGIEYLIKELPEMMFYIAANTQVSNKLYSLGTWENVQIYPQISGQNLEKMWEDCDFYLDINYYREIYDAINTASRRNLVILGFEDTLHDEDLVAEECVCCRSDYEGMVRKIKDLLNNKSKIQLMLEQQQGRRKACWSRIEALLGSEGERIG